MPVFCQGSEAASHNVFEPPLTESALKYYFPLFFLIPKNFLKIGEISPGDLTITIFIKMLPSKPIIIVCRIINYDKDQQKKGRITPFL